VKSPAASIDWGFLVGLRSAIGSVFYIFLTPAIYAVMRYVLPVPA
jgi:hypothetical protein